MQNQQHKPARQIEVIAVFHLRIQLRSANVSEAIPYGVSDAVSHSRQHCASGTRFLSARATALLFRTCANGLRALGLDNTAQVLLNSPVSRNLAPLRALAGTLPGTGKELQSLRSAAGARLNSSASFEAARTAPDPEPFPRLRLGQSRFGVWRASRLKHRISRAWAHSFRSRSLGLAHASDTTGSLTRWGATVTFRRLGASNCVSPVLGHLRGCPAWAGAILAKIKSPALAVSARQQSCRSFQSSALGGAHVVSAFSVRFAINKSQSGDTKHMALLRVDTPGKPNLVKIELDGNTHARLRRYSRFTNNGTVHSIVKSALNYCFDADKEFLEWEKDPANQQEPESPKRRRRGTPATATGSTTASEGAAGAAKR